ncbi:MAG: hypothetical protein KGH74_03595 [Candidatus Micrarchaeota archaeon]|nr:hypothetical protein [Candidatus Micrarchaeota archaeon]
MELSDQGVFVCNICGTTKVSRVALPVLLVRSGISGILFVGGFMLLLLATVMFSAFPEFEVTLTWSLLYSLYLVYFGLAFVNFKRKLYA